jgi:hypothetical protein
LGKKTEGAIELLRNQSSQTAPERRNRAGSGGASIAAIDSN